MELEVCIDSVEGALIASKHGATRVELCAALSEGGLTPSAAMIEAVSKVSTAQVYVMIRPSAGGFVYSDTELELMERDIRVAKEMGANGVVFGVLKEDHTIDIQKNMFLMETAFSLNLGTTLHRAIDLCPDLPNAVEHAINIGFNRILTSGGKPTAAEGIETIKAMAEASENQIDIMAGSGINPDNCLLFSSISIQAVHCTAKRPIVEGLPLDMGPKYQVDEGKIQTIQTLLQGS